jgi:hypothetical protein
MDLKQIRCIRCHILIDLNGNVETCQNCTGKSAYDPKEELSMLNLQLMKRDLEYQTLFKVHCDYIDAQRDKIENRVKLQYVNIELKNKLEDAEDEIEKLEKDMDELLKKCKSCSKCNPKPQAEDSDSESESNKKKTNSKKKVTFKKK